jgi:hypothetical protein
MDDTTSAPAMAELQPPVAYLPCRLDDQGELAEVMTAELEDGRIALSGTPLWTAS